MTATPHMIVAGLAAMVLAGCAAGAVDPDAAAPAASDSPAVTAPVGAESLLAGYDLDGLDTVQVIDHLDRLGGDERPADLMASVRPDELLLSSGEEEVSLDVPEDRFYLSVAPYLDQTHECFHHSLTTCQGELTAEDVHVRIVDETHDTVLVEGTRTTFENGFVGFWLPRDIEGTLQVTHDGKVGEVAFATDEDAPTCVTTLQLT